MGTIYYQNEYEAEDPGDLNVDDVGQATYVPGGGFAGSNCWEIRLLGDHGNEDHAGWLYPFGPELPTMDQGGTNTLFVGHLVYLSAGLVDKMATDHVGGKMLDTGMYPVQGDPSTRQTIIWGWRDSPDAGFADTGATGVVPALVKGGAGGSYVRQVGPIQFDFRDYADQWVWIEHEFDALGGTTSMWIKTQDGVFSGAHSAPLMHREAGNPDDWVHEYWTEEPYDYTDQGWAYPGVLWGYWDDLDGIPFTDADFVRLDHVILSSGWIEPPF